MERSGGERPARAGGNTLTEQTTTAAEIGLPREALLEMNYYMRMTRSLEERIVILFRQSKVIGGIYRSLGQEGEAVAAAYALDFASGDVVSPLIRNMGAMLVAGATPLEILRQYMAKGNAPSRGRDLKSTSRISTAASSVPSRCSAT